MKVFIGLVAALLIVAAGGLLVILSGLINVAATDPDSPMT